MKTLSFPSRKIALRPFQLLCCLGTFVLGPVALPAETLSGRVVDAATLAPLEAAAVTLPGTEQRTRTDAQGRFQFANIVPGSVPVTISYLGLETLQRTVTVVPGAGASAEFALEREALWLDAVMVSGSTGAQVAALNQQRESSAISNVISADQAGRFPDANAAEAMRRIPGVSIEREEKAGDGRYVSIRGLDSGLNAFSINGMRVAQSDEENRRVPLDTIHTGALSKITVYKSLTPDLDGDGIGGAVEMATATAFELGRPVRSLTLEGIYQDFAGELGYLAGGTFADVFGAEDQFGLLVSFTMEDRDTAGFVVGNDEEWIPVDEDNATQNAAWHPGEEMEYNTYANNREKWGLSAALEWKLSPTTELYFKASLNQFTDTELNNGRHFVMDDFEFDALQDPAVPLSYSTDNAVLAYGEYEQTEWELSNYIAGGTTRLGAVRLDYSAAYSTGQQEEPRDFEVFYAAELEDALGWDLSDPNFPRPIMTAADAARLADPANYEFDEVDMDYDQSEDTKWAVKLDATWAVNETLVLQAGVKGQFSERELNEANRFQSDEARHDSLATSGLLGGDSSFGDIGQSLVILGYDAGALDQLFVNRNNLFEDTTDPIPDEDSYVANEDIYAGYLMGTWNLGRWEIVGGARVEYTEVETHNQELVVIVDEDDPAYGEDQPGWNPYEEENYLLAPLSSRSTYTEVLPRLQVNYRASDRLVYRAAAFTSLARPEFQFISGATEAERDGGEYEVSLGNPDLEAAYAWNFDLGVEYYLDGIGLVSVNGFFKSIDGFIFNDAAPENEYDGQFLGSPATFEQPVNGNTAKIHGIEFNYVTRFTSLPGVMSGLGFYGNLTLQDSEADTGLDDANLTDVPFFNAPDYVGTVALTYDRSGWDCSLSYSFRDGYLDELMDGINIYAQPYESLDLQLAYTWNQVTFSVKVQDLLDSGDSPIRTLTRGDSRRFLNENSWNGRTVRFGTSWSF
ncbi:TonB-dependent receptor [Actomonas aquatica]|uniref:TonB-dependent receptor n=1 Tax=Actomonas aquatica TaxID=2866162 RepID=A0ABZ1C3S6_9BACT|nr:TonB-dependent receptor [Opitutus sp. WL0086]WRQ85938.1 TonB-dependent receptor [Opitutus sp. WL0086]